MLDVQDGRGHVCIFARPRHQHFLAGHIVYFNPVEVILQRSVAAGGRDQAGIGFRRRDHRTRRQTRSGRRMPGLPARHITKRSFTGDRGGRREGQQAHLPGRLVPRRRVDIERRLDQFRILKVSHLTAPDVQVHERTLRGKCRHWQEGRAVLLLQDGIELQVSAMVLSRMPIDIDPARADGKLTGKVPDLKSVRRVR